MFLTCEFCGKRIDSNVFSEKGKGIVFFCSPDCEDNWFYNDSDSEFDEYGSM